MIAIGSNIRLRNAFGNFMTDTSSDTHPQARAQISITLQIGSAVPVLELVEFSKIAAAKGLTAEGLMIEMIQAKVRESSIQPAA